MTHRILKLFSRINYQYLRVVIVFCLMFLILPSYSQLTSSQIDSLSDKLILSLQQKDFYIYQNLFANTDMYTDYYFKSAETENRGYTSVRKIKEGYEYNLDVINNYINILYLEKELNFYWKNIEYITYKISRPEQMNSIAGYNTSLISIFILIKDKSSTKKYIMDSDMACLNNMPIFFKINDIKECNSFDEYQNKYKIYEKGEPVDLNIEEISPK